MVNFATLVREQWTYIFMPIGLLMGVYFDKLLDQQLTGFRNKSALYRRELKPGEEVTWK